MIQGNEKIKLVDEQEARRELIEKYGCDSMTIVTPTRHAPYNRELFELLYNMCLTTMIDDKILVVDDLSREDMAIIAEAAMWRFQDTYESEFMDMYKPIEFVKNPDAVAHMTTHIMHVVIGYVHDGERYGFDVKTVDILDAFLDDDEIKKRFKDVNDN